MFVDAWDKGRPLGSIEVTELEGHLVEVTTARQYLAMKAEAAKEGVHLAIVSGFRTFAKQKELYQRYVDGTGNVAAKPGYSNHQDGTALDLNTKAAGVLAWLRKNAVRFGFSNAEGASVGEDWHWVRVGPIATNRAVASSSSSPSSSGFGGALVGLSIFAAAVAAFLLV